MTTATNESLPARFRSLVASTYGLHFDDSKLGQLAEIVERQARLRAQSPARYIADLEQSRTGLEAPPEDLTVGETYFFRNTAQFNALREHVLPERLAARGGDGRLSILSAGCSSGEEAYTLAMVAREAVDMRSWAVDIRAVDVNPAALKRAERARYGAWALRETPAAMLQRWFVHEGRETVLVDELRRSVRFDRANLADATGDVWQNEAYDVIFCRNVIMYFTPATQRAVVARLARSLVPGGYLFLGHAETLRGLSRDFTLIHTNDTFYYRRVGDSKIRVAPEDDDAARPWSPGAEAEPERPDTNWYRAIEVATDRIEVLAKRRHRSATAPRSDRVPQGPAPGVARVLELLRAERFLDALAVLESLPTSPAPDPDVKLLEAILCVHAGRIAAAAGLATSLIEADEFNAGAIYALGLCLEAAGDMGGAIAQYGTAIYLDPTFAMPRLRRGMLSRGASSAQARTDFIEAAALLEAEDSSRLLLFGGGFSRAALIALCNAEAPPRPGSG